MKPSNPSSRGKEKKKDGELELTHGLAEATEATEAQARDDGILAAIHALRKDFSAQLNEVIISNHQIKEALESFSERLSGAESRISSTEDQLSNLANVSATTQRKMLALTRSVETLENQQRRLNARLTPPSIDQAFRLPKAAKANKQNLKPFPRAILVKFRWLADRDRVMRAARKKKTLQFEENRVMLFPDLSAEIQQQRRMFDGMKTRLHNLNIEFGLQFPAKMRIYHKGKTLTFLTPSDVEVFLREIETERAGDMTKFIRKLCSRFMAPAALRGDVLDIPYKDPQHQLPGERLNVDFTTRGTLNRFLEAGDVPSNKAQQFQQAALAFLVGAVEYAIAKLPLKDALLKYARFVDVQLGAECGVEDALYFEQDQVSEEFMEYQLMNTMPEDPTVFDVEEFWGRMASTKNKMQKGCFPWLV
ncbi:LINE-1 type transposase domain-containing protein 1 [Liparis tanakae]|uniref:LINE-1 type transposase domain-containing protein 1 n=1 Tax=Liparis tanakae TaxID=230148 RepID=A0A4Z2IDV2_9TELE|nr:LINE-1 type transposase domain-containing protein 1 [Liparis tanakae]